MRRTRQSTLQTRQRNRCQATLVTPGVDLRTRREVIRASYGRSFGWYIELDGERLGTLTDPLSSDQFWVSYHIEQTASEAHVDLFSHGVWYPECKLAYRNRYTLTLAPHAFPAPLATDLRSTRRISMRALYLAVPSWLSALRTTLRG